jgi:hypothetical protein
VNITTPNYFFSTFVKKKEIAPSFRITNGPSNKLCAMKIASTIWEAMPFFIENKEMNLLSFDEF